MRNIFTFTILSVFAAAATAITCYDCNSLSDPRCNQYFYPEGVKQTNCDEAEMPEYLQKFERRIDATGCITKIHTGVDSNRYYIRRGCFFGFDEKEACEQEDPYVPWVELLDCQVCKEDLCNNNFSQRAVLSNIFLTITIALCLVGI